MKIMGVNGSFKNGFNHYNAETIQKNLEIIFLLIKNCLQN